jgi:opacity protein-like surface antigen
MFVAGCLAVWCIAAAQPARAELFLHVYLGATLGVEGEVAVREGTARATGEADFSADITAGGRVGYWFRRLPWLGVALDGSFFQPAVESLFTLTTTHDAELTVGSLSGLMMLRPLPQWHLQPYAGIGPAVFFAHLDVDTFSATDTALGLDVRAGLDWRFLPPFGLFVEYRFTHVAHEFSDLFRGVPTVVKTTLDNHHILFGVSLRF